MRLGDWSGAPARSSRTWPGIVPVGPGDLDGDGDGRPDTVVAARADGGAWVFTDTDGDGLADQVVDLGADPGDDPSDGDPADDDPADDDPLAFLTRWLTG